jgi:hypothetical protein
MKNKSIKPLLILLLSCCVIVAAVKTISPADQIKAANKVIAKQNALIATQQNQINTIDPDKTKTIATDKARIIKENTIIAQEQALIASLTTIVSPPPTTASNAIQNSSTYTFTLTQVAILKATCNPLCTPTTILAPQAIQTYSFTDPSGYITFDYDIKTGSTFVAHITLQATPTALNITNGLGASITPGTQASAVNYIPPTPYWQGTFSDLTDWTKNNWNFSKVLPSWGAQDITIIASGVTEHSPKGDNFIRIQYPAGSANSGASPPLPLGGTQFYGSMINTNAPVTLSFYILFPTTFPFNTGKTTVGKLPGLFGGIGNTGRNVPTGSDGWTTRFTWCDYVESTNQSVSGGGQVLQFTYGSNTGTYGHDYGTNLGCNIWKFVADGKWHNVQQTVHLNDVGKTNGRIDVCVDGLPVFSQSGITFRTISTLQTNGILFQTFFGGSGAAYATPIATHADFADFSLYLYPASVAPGLCLTNE